MNKELWYLFMAVLFVGVLGFNFICLIEGSGMIIQKAFPIFERIGTWRTGIASVILSIGIIYIASLVHTMYKNKFQQGE